MTLLFCCSESFADATDSCHRNQADNRGQPEFTDPGLWPVCSRAPWLADSPGEDAEVTEGHSRGYFRYWTDHHETKGIYPRDAVQLIVRYPACFVLLLNLTPNEIYLNKMSIFFFTVLWMFIICNFFLSITCTHQMSFALCGRLSASAVRVWIWRSTIWARSNLKLCMHWSVIFMSNFWSLRSVITNIPVTYLPPFRPSFLLPPLVLLLSAV